MGPEKIGSRRELFVDDYLIDEMRGGTLKLHSPAAGEVALAPPHPPGSNIHYLTIFRDGSVYRMYYGVRKPNFSGDGTPVDKGQLRICYAESEDGLTWKTPSLGVISSDECPAGNAVLEKPDAMKSIGAGFCPFRDENPGCDPLHRYKAVVCGSFRDAPDDELLEMEGSGDEGTGGEKCKSPHGGLVAFSSPDGLNWSLLKNGTIMSGGPGRGMFDSQNLVFWDTARGEYRMYRREIFKEGPQNNYREILTATSDDFLNWSDPQRISYRGASPLVPPFGVPAQLYTNYVIPYFRAPHIFVAFPNRYIERPMSEAIRDLPEWRMRKHTMEKLRVNAKGRQVRIPRLGAALTDTLFMSSRDGTSFCRWDEAFLRPGLRHENNWFYGDNFFNWGIITTPGALEGAPDELSFYVTERSRSEDHKLIRRYTLRMDGFVSVNAPLSGAEVITRPLIFEGSELSINFSASAAGSLRVEIQDVTGWAKPGFELENCVEALGDDLDRRIRWKNGQDVSALAGAPVRIRFQLFDADLFAFRFCGAER